MMYPPPKCTDCLNGVMIRLLATSAKGPGFYPQYGQTKTLKFVFAASLLSMQYLGVRANIGQSRVRLMCFGKVACLPRNCCFHELTHKKSGFCLYV